MSDPTISVDELKALIGSADLTIFDASWYMPADKRDTRAEFVAAHLPGAVFFDIDALSDATIPLPHMLPKAEAFSADMRRLGLRHGQRVVVYDTAGMFSAPRAWWMLRAFGVPTVQVLEGGLPAWRAAGGEMVSGETSPAQGNVVLTLDPQAVASLDEVQQISGSGADTVIVDARGAARFTGEAADPRAGVSPGHIPGSRNVPFGEVLAPGGYLKPAAELAEVFGKAGVPLDAPIVTSCGSGVTAAVLTLALATLGRTDVKLYDGSWAEWGSRPDTAKATGPAD